jgi:chromosome segregation ATPase
MLVGYGAIFPEQSGMSPAATGGNADIMEREMNTIRSLKAKLVDAAARGIEAVAVAGMGDEDLAKSDVLKAEMEAAAEAARCSEGLANKAIAQQNRRISELIAMVESLKGNPTPEVRLAFAESVSSLPDEIGKASELCIQAATAFTHLRMAHDAFIQDVISRLWKGYHEAKALEQSYVADIKRARKCAANRGQVNFEIPAVDAAIQDCRQVMAELKGRIDALDATVKRFHEMSKEDVDSWHTSDATCAAQLAWFSEKVAPFALSVLGL